MSICTLNPVFFQRLSRMPVGCNVKKSDTVRSEVRVTTCNKQLPQNQAARRGCHVQCRCRSRVGNASARRVPRETELKSGARSDPRFTDFLRRMGLQPYRRYNEVLLLGG